MPEVKCYDCGKLVPQGEAIRQNEQGGNVGGVGYGHRSGWGVGGGRWGSEGKSYWLCHDCDKRRIEKKRFWQLVWIGIGVGLALIILIIALVVNTMKNK